MAAKLHMPNKIVTKLRQVEVLASHCDVDLEWLPAIQKSGSMFAHVGQVACSMPGAAPEAQQLDDACDGDVEAVVAAATA